jgi:hypothetical protein
MQWVVGITAGIVAGLWMASMSAHDVGSTPSHVQRVRRMRDDLSS